MRNKIIAVILIVLQAAFQAASAQCGDSCITATPIVVTATGPCIEDTCTTIGSTPGGPGPTPCSGWNLNDVWFTFTVPAGVTNLIAQVQGMATGMTKPVVYGYRGSCGTLNSLGCNAGMTPLAMVALNLHGLFPGEQIWVRVQPVFGTPDGDFRICVFNPCAAGSPPNDDPCSATFVPLTVNCSAYTTLTNYCAGNSAGIPAPGCATYSGGDVWVQTVVGTSGQLVVSFEEQTITNVGCALYSGTCTALSLVACSDNQGPNFMPLLDLSGLLPGSTVWIRIWSSGNFGAGTTGICIRDGCFSAAPPVYDDPCGAAFVPLSATCTSFVSVSNVCATPTLSIPVPSCSSFAGYAGDDIWVRTTASASGHLVITFQQQTLSNIGVAVYTGTCGALNERFCRGGMWPEISLAGLAASADVWVRIWDHADASGDTGSVGICMSDPCFNSVFDDPPCPMPDSAFEYLSVTFGACTIYTSLNSYCAGASFGSFPPGIPIPAGCATVYPPGSVAGWDVWMPFIVPDTSLPGVMEINTQPGSEADLDMAIYKLASPVDSACSNGTQYTLISCVDAGGTAGYMPFLRFRFGGSHPIQPGDTLLIRMWSHGGGPRGSWQICISKVCNGMLPPAYDDPPCPASATLIPVNAGNCITYQSGDNLCATATTVPANPGCGWNNSIDVWYVVQMPAGGSGILGFSFQPGHSLSDLGMAVYSGIPPACGGTGLTMLACDDDGGPGYLPYLSLTNPVLPGDYLFIRVWAYGGYVPGDFALCVADLCPTGTVTPPLFDSPPCPMPDSSSHYLQVTRGICPDYIVCNSRCANSVFGTSPPGILIPSGCSAAAYPPGAATGWDVWAPVVVPDTPVAGFLTIRALNNLEVQNLDMAVYRIQPPSSLNCGDGTRYELIACNDANGPGNMPFLSLPYDSLQTIHAGDSLLVRMWSRNGTDSGGTWLLGVNITTIAPEEICMVTVNNVTAKNVIIWEKHAGAGVEQYRIYRETSPGAYVPVGGLDTLAPGILTDINSIPNTSAYGYVMGILDTCGYESMTDLLHRTMHLSVAPDSAGAWSLAWNSYKGFYSPWTYILRGPTLNSLVAIDSVPAGQLTYTDTSAPAGFLFYVVEVKKPTGCMPSLTPPLVYPASQSNAVAVISVGLPEEITLYALEIRPNPVLHSAEISFSLTQAATLRISILDLAGREVSVLKEGGMAAGNHLIPWDGTDRQNHLVAGGVYFLKLEAGNFSVTKKVVVLPY